MMKLIKNGKVLQNGELQQADILIDGKVIKQIAPAIEPSNGVDIIDAKGHFCVTWICRCSCSFTRTWW